VLIGNRIGRLVLPVVARAWWRETSGAWHWRLGQRKHARYYDRPPLLSEESDIRVWGVKCWRTREIVESNIQCNATVTVLVGMTYLTEVWTHKYLHSPAHVASNWECQSYVIYYAHFYLLLLMLPLIRGANTKSEYFTFAQSCLWFMNNVFCVFACQILILTMSYICAFLLATSWLFLLVVKLIVAILTA